MDKLNIKDKSKENQNIKIAPFKKHTRKTVPHKHNNYFEVIYLTEGEGTHTIDSRTYPIKTPIVFTIRKEQVHFWDFESEPNGFVLIIKKSFIENCLDKEIKRIISDLSSHNCLYPKNNSAVEIYKILLHEYVTNGESNQPIIDGLLKALLATLLNAVKPSDIKNSNNSIYQKFINILNQEDQLTNSVTHFSNMLNTTPQNLNAICRKESKQSSTEIISKYIVNEAKRLLIYTDLTVIEISAKLDFKDNSHFSKYFKRNTLKTPIQFRNENK
ncbi:MAG TPA: helix-turn-helix transcriptional regulator [Brumimicrobium sp.]|nr:helix-turn-helix transcriptional regulator [Brumimicrobium sp.]